MPIAELAPAPDRKSSRIVESPLGRLRSRAPRHERTDKKSQLDPSKFGVKQEEIEKLYRQIRKPEVPVVVAVAPTGSGKSTYLPYRLLSPFEHEWIDPDHFTRNGTIVVTQPRIPPTREIPAFVSNVMHGADFGRGHEIGFRYSGNPASDWRSRLVYVTDGSLINWLANGDLDKIGLVMIDEAHERSLNIDIILGLLARLLPMYPHCKVIIASATIDAEAFKRFFDGNLPGQLRCEIVNLSGKKSHRVTKHFRDPALPSLPYTRKLTKELDHAMAGHVADEVIRVLRMMAPPGTSDNETPEGRVRRGDVVAFLHGRRAIDECVEAIRVAGKTLDGVGDKLDVYPLYRDVPKKEQDKAIQAKRDSSRIRVVVSSNMAETSLTIEGIVHVVDSGVIKVNEWDPVAEKEELNSKTHSKSGCTQRWGRAGRLTSGDAWCLYTQEQFDDSELFPDHSVAEIRRSRLDDVVLNARRAGAADLTRGSFPWIEPPEDEEFGRAEARLRRKGAIDDDGDLTESGHAMRGGGLDPSLSRLLSVADRFSCGVEAATIIPMLENGLHRIFVSTRDMDDARKQVVQDRQDVLRTSCEDDLELCLRLYSDWESAQAGGEVITTASDWQFAPGRPTKSAVETLGEERAAELETRLTGLQTLDDLESIRAEFAGKHARVHEWLDRVAAQFRGAAGRIWAARLAVEDAFMHDTVHKAREELLEKLGVGKKERERRPIDFDTLPRLRVLFAWALAEEGYVADRVKTPADARWNGPRSPMRNTEYLPVAIMSRPARPRPHHRPIIGCGRRSTRSADLLRFASASRTERGSRGASQTTSKLHSANQ